MCDLDILLNFSGLILLIWKWDKELQPSHLKVKIKYMKVSVWHEECIYSFLLFGIECEYMSHF